MLPEEQRFLDRRQSMIFANKLRLIALAIFASAFLSVNRYPLESIIMAIILLAATISIKKRNLKRDL